MTHEELRKKVAQALFANTWDDQLLGALRWEDCTDEHAQWLERADAAIAAVREALREPSEGMKTAADERNDEEPPNSWGKHRPAPFAEIWKAMLAASPLADPRA